MFCFLNSHKESYNVEQYLQDNYFLLSNMKTFFLKVYYLSTPTSFFINNYFCGIMFLHTIFLFYRYLQPPNFWVVCSLESRELMALCLKRLKNLSKVKLIDAIFVWTEPHSKRIKVRIWKFKKLLLITVLFLLQPIISWFATANGSKWKQKLDILYLVRKVPNS